MIRFSHAFHIKLDSVFLYLEVKINISKTQGFKTETLQRQCRWHVLKLKHPNDGVAGMF